MSNKIVCTCGYETPDRGQQIVYCSNCQRLFHVTHFGGVGHFLVPSHKADDGVQLWKCPPGECSQPTDNIVGPDA